MSTSLLYHAFGLRGYRHVRSSFAGGRVTLRVRQASRPTPLLRSAAATTSGPKGASPATFRTVPIGPKPVQIEFAVPRVYCFGCGTRPPGEVALRRPRKSYTRAFERYALDLSRHMTIKAVAQHLQVSWDTIKEIQASSLKRRYRSYSALTWSGSVVTSQRANIRPGLLNLAILLSNSSTSVITGSLTSVPPFYPQPNRP